MAAAKRTPLETPSEEDKLRTTMRRCADELDQAIALRFGVMDSESKAIEVTRQRTEAMAKVAARLREAALG